MTKETFSDLNIIIDGEMCKVDGHIIYNGDFGDLDDIIEYDYSVYDDQGYSVDFCAEEISTDIYLILNLFTNPADRNLERVK